MPFAEAHEITRLLTAYRAGDAAAAAELIGLVYEELRQLARQYLRQERADHTLQPTALVHEVYLRLFGENTIEYQDRGHFFLIAARQMRRILVDHARARYAARRAGDLIKVSLEELVETPQEIQHDLAALDEALADLERLHPRSSQVVELRFFGGLTEQETAGVLDISVSTVKRDWEFAKVWLYSQVQSASALIDARKNS
jgi:RNA polymerase sigma factor (TIGR02999 family)